jgi:hypothetical protein
LGWLIISWRNVSRFTKRTEARPRMPLLQLTELKHLWIELCREKKMTFKKMCLKATCDCSSTQGIF